MTIRSMPNNKEFEDNYEKVYKKPVKEPKKCGCVSPTKAIKEKGALVTYCCKCGQVTERRECMHLYRYLDKKRKAFICNDCQEPLEEVFIEETPDEDELDDESDLGVSW